MKKLEIRRAHNGEAECWALVVDGEVFDWGVSAEDARAASEAVARDPAMRQVVLGNLQRHFVDSFSEFVGRTMTLAEINQAISTGEIA